MLSRSVVSTLLLWTLCLQGSHAGSITVVLNTTNQNQHTVYIPQSCQLYINATGCGPSCNWNLTSDGSAVSDCTGGKCVGPSCCLRPNANVSLNISKLSASPSLAPFTLNIVVKSETMYGCSVYLFPLELVPPLKFECLPVVCGSTNAIGDVHVDWVFRSSANPAGVTVTNSTDGTIRVTHNGVEIGGRATVQVAGSYTPKLAGDNTTKLLAEQQIYRLQFENLEEPSLVHSTAVIKGEKVTLSCTVESEPNATIRWTFEPKDRGCLVSTLNKTATKYPSSRQFLSEYATQSAEYCDAGIYVCTASNGFKEISTKLRLRVRDPLRPLWPAIGIVSCIAITAVFILIGTKVDDIIAKKKAKEASNNANFRRSSSAADYNVATTPTGEAVRFRKGSRLTFETSASSPGVSTPSTTPI